MITSKYPVQNSNKFIEISINTPEKALKEIEYQCEWKIITDTNDNLSGISYGTDPMQCVLIAYRTLALEIVKWENESGKNCEYYFMPSPELRQFVEYWQSFTK